VLDASRQTAVLIQKEAPGEGAKLMFKIIIRVVVLTGMILWALTKTAA